MKKLSVILTCLTLLCFTACNQLPITNSSSPSTTPTESPSVTPTESPSVSPSLSESPNAQDDYFVVEDGTVVALTETGKSQTELVVPEQIDGVTITKIGEKAFSGAQATSVSLTDTITEIKHYAFVFCNNLTDITIPNGVTEIRSGTFWGCTALERVGMHEGITAIHAWAFTDCESLVSLDIPASVNEIDQWMIGRSAVSELRYAGTLDQWCQITFTRNAKFDQSAGAESVSPQISYPQTYMFEQDVTLFVGGSPVTQAEINVENVSANAFYAYDKLESVSFGASVKNIGVNAFTSCSGLTSVTFADALSWTVGNADESVVDTSLGTDMVLNLTDTYSGFEWIKQE